MNRRKFTKEFKEEAVRLSRESGRAIREVAENVG
jgi:transposase-like protein